MTTTATPATGSGRPPGLLDAEAFEHASFATLVGLEARKMVDTLAGRWLAVATAVLLALAAGVTLVVALLNDLTLSPNVLLQVLAVPLSLLLPVFAIQVVTSEWSQRTGLVTFTLEPSRMRSVLAKLVTVVLLALATMLVAVVLGAVVNLLFGALSGGSASWALDAGPFAWNVVSQLLFFVMAFGFGLLLLSTPAAIAIYYVVALLLPLLVYGPVFGLVSWGPDVVPWVDLTFALDPFLNGRDVDATSWLRLLVTAGAWVGLPLLLGAARVRRTEVK